ncbi:hypothetical protein H8356DRAFT_1366429 [Neocallimastix lanati (nom. inval.)]|nr:hypothetical protein H8356DRAFT_1366429 [Neocallimastix sp. JGI-2020a]
MSCSFKLLFDRYSKLPNLTKSVDVVLIRHNDNTGSSSISTKGESRPSSSINDESGESLVVTTLSILKMLLLGFISFLFVRKGKNSRIVQLAEMHNVLITVFYNSDDNQCTKRENLEYSDNENNNTDIINLNYKKEWSVLVIYHIISGLLFQRNKTKLTRSVNAEAQEIYTIKTNVSEGEDRIFFQIVNSNPNPE